MNKKTQIIILIVIIIAALLVWALYLKGGNNAAPQPVQPVAEDNGKYAPKLNNTLQTSVTVINPNEGQPVTK